MSIAFSNLESQRTFGGKLVVVLTWMMVLVVVAAKIAVGGSAIGVGVASGLIAAASTAALAAGGRGSMGRSLTGVALMAQVSLLVAAMAGHVWQIDMHMTYFATLALLTIYCDAAVIAAAAATVAVHHLGLSFLLPMAVFPGAANLGRVVVHAFILVVEAATLMGVALSVSAMFESADAARRKAEDAVAEIHAANAAAQAAQRSEELGRMKFSDAQARIEAERAKTVATFAQQLSRLAAGDLTARIEEDFEVDYAQIKIDFNSAARSLEAAMVAIDGAAGGIRRGADEIASASNDLSRRTEHQAASLQETAAALDEVTVTVKNSALGAKDASSLVSSTRADAERAGLVVREAVAAMGQIEQGSSQITQIIGVIDEIAFQTNLLALNAGVEAARAGDAGRGFAVVAQEVRALAQRSATSAKQIKALIATSTDQVKRGVHLVGDTGSALDVIVVKVAEMDQIIATMANSSQEQAHALGQVNVAINEMDQVTQENAAMVEQTTAAAATLRAGAAELDERVARFQTGGRAPPSHLDTGSGRARRSNPVQRLHSRLAASLG